MSYSQVRTFFKQQIEAASTTRSEWTDALDVVLASNVPGTTLDQRYHLQMGAILSTNRDATVQDQMSVIVTIWKRAFVDQLGSQDTLLDEAHCIRHSIINPQDCFAFGGDIDSVFAVSTTPGAIDVSNDNIIQIQMEFQVELNFSTVPVS